MAEQEQGKEEDENKRIRPRERARGQKYNVTSQRIHPYCEQSRGDVRLPLWVTEYSTTPFAGSH